MRFSSHHRDKSGRKGLVCTFEPAREQERYFLDQPLGSYTTLLNSIAAPPLR